MSRCADIVRGHHISLAPDVSMSAGSLIKGNLESTRIGVSNMQYRKFGYFRSDIVSSASSYIVVVMNN